jgi:hypothetical protein
MPLPLIKFNPTIIVGVFIIGLWYLYIMKYVITERQYKIITEQDQQPRETLNPESINGDFSLTLYVDPSLVKVNGEEITQIMTEEFNELAPNMGIHVRTIMKSRINPGYTDINFELNVKNKDTMKQSPWLSNFGRNVKNKISEIYKGEGINVNVTEPKYIWGQQFKSEPTNDPNKCVGVTFFVTPSK